MWLVLLTQDIYLRFTSPNALHPWNSLNMRTVEEIPMLCVCTLFFPLFTMEKGSLILSWTNLSSYILHLYSYSYQGSHFYLSSLSPES